MILSLLAFHVHDIIRLITVASTSLTLGVCIGVAWRWRNKQTAPTYIKVMGVGYLGYAAFTLAATEAAWRNDRPLNWISILGAAAGLAGLVGAIAAVKNHL